MVASRIKENQDNPTRQQVDAVIVAAAQYISSWTHHEFSQLSKNKRIPLIWPLPTGGYRIGKFSVIPAGGYWQLLDYNRELEHEFDGKQSAIFYCLCEQVHSYYLATQIKSADLEVKRLKNDLTHYETSKNRAINSQDIIGISIWTARFEDARLRLETAQKTLKKSIESAKYLKVWTE
jgi:hypothetical protein